MTTLIGADARWIFLEEGLIQGDLGSINLSGARLNKVRFQSSNLTHADLSEAILLEADLSSARLEQVNFSKALWLDGKKCQDKSLGSCQR